MRQGASYFDAFKLRTFEDTSIDSIEGFKHYAGEAPDGPFTINNRYVTEDVPMGLGLLHSLGRHLKIATPVCDSLINLSNVLIPSHNYYDEARKLENIWDGTLDELIQKISTD